MLNTLARGARHLDANADKAAAGLDRVTAWCGVVAAGLLFAGFAQIPVPADCTTLVAWQTRHGVYYVSNTLTRELSYLQMLAIARSLTHVGH